MTTLLTLLLGLLGCNNDQRLTLLIPPEDVEIFAAYTEGLSLEQITLKEEEDPAGAVSRGRGFKVAVVRDLDCVECYELSGEGREYVVRAGDILGAQYGVSELLERFGFRFFHPQHTLSPEALSEVDPSELGDRKAPAIARRGVHMHTLHPTEGYFDFWEPGAENLTRAKNVIDWVVKNRGNHIQWVALDDIISSPSDRAAWAEHTAAIQTYARLRGVTTGLGIQLFGSGNLQQAFDLLDDVGSEAEQAAALAERMALVTDGVDFDLFNLSFGEFFGESPEQFIASGNLAWEAAAAAEPGVEMTTVIHVGDDLQLKYDGREMIYYFLADYLDEEVVPWVHTVMYYNLFEDPGGAYHHEDFDQHRAFLLDKIEAGEPVGYFPESAYWIAFDNSVPTYLPLYVRSRFTDLDEVRARTGDVSGIRNHVLFSSGWEWGYWQQDRAFLSMSFEVPGDWCDLMRWDWATHGEDGAAVAAAICETADVQHRFLLEKRLAAYFASRDNIMELGYGLGILSQPRPVLYDELEDYDAQQLAAFKEEVVGGMYDLSEALGEVRSGVADLESSSDDPWIREVLDGLVINQNRAAYASAVYGAVVTSLEGNNPMNDLERAEALLENSRQVVADRYDGFHDPDPARLVEPRENATIYSYGYLIRADELCYWERELLQARNVALGESNEVPGCSL